MNYTLSLDSRIRAFAELGKIMGIAAESLSVPDPDFKHQYPAFYDSIQSASLYNPWFTTSNIAYALRTWQSVLSFDSIATWINAYRPGIQTIVSKKIAVVMAGNIPLVGFHDFICTLMSGHSIIGKLSSDDKILLPAIADVLCTIEPLFKPLIEFTESTIKDFDAIIATGSNNTARYFEYYFLKHPHIIRKNRNGIAVLSGNESADAMAKLGSDIFTYFGLGCRNVSNVFIPSGYDVKTLFMAVEPYLKVLSDHNKFMNNHSYHQSVYLLNKTPHLDNGVFILTESERYASPIAVLHYQFYNNINTLHEKFSQDDELIQCIANDMFTGEKAVPLGTTQKPELSDYADGIDTVKFLLDL
jgi:hypothetical protein